MRTAILASAFCAVTLLAPAALAQSGSAIIYRDPGYQGPAVSVERPQTNLGLAWPVRSIRVQSGEWELCARSRFRNPCMRINSSSPDLARSHNFSGTLQSMRPVTPAFTKPTPLPSPAPGGGYSLRGMAAEFFPAPARGGQRVLACPRGSATAACAAESAKQFCASAGWVGSRSESMETVNRRVYLADVLCARSFVR